MQPREVVEWFLLREEGARARSIDPATAERARTHLRHAALERGVAMERWLSGDAADALESITRACDHAAHAAAAVERPADEPIAEDAPVREQFAARLTRYDAITRDVERLVAAPVRRWLRRAVRIGLPILLVAFSVRLGYRMRRFVHPIASAQFGPKFDARYAVDGRKDTAWIAPDGTNAYIDFELMPPRKIQVIRLLDTRNPPQDDREVTRFRIEFWRDGLPREALEGGYPADDVPKWVAINVDKTWKVDKVRFVIKSFARKGGGLAEIEFK